MSYIIITVAALGGAYAIYRMIKKNDGKKIGKVSTHSFNFPEFDRARIENGIDLTKKAEEDAQFKRPHANSKERSICEGEAVDKIRDQLDKSIKRANEYFAPITNKIDELRVKIRQKHFYIQETTNRISEILEQAKTTLQTQKLIFDKEDQDVNTFRNLNGIGRQPQVLTFNLMIFQIGIVLALFFGEGFANMKLLAEAIGEQEGYTYSFAVAGLNVMVSALVGYFVLKGAANLKQRAARSWLIFVMFLYVILITYINFCLGAVRAIYDTTGESTDPVGISLGGTEGGLNPLYFWTVDWTLNSFLLTLVGITFAAISLIDAYLYNDPYPGYGSTAKKREEARKEINRTSENLANEVQKVFNNEHSKGGHKLKDLLDKDLNELVNYSNHITHVFDGYKNYIFELERGINHICEEYRRINGNIRTDGVRPAYWDQPFTFTDRLKNPEETFANCKDYYFKGNTIQEEIANHQKRLTDEQIQYEKDLNSLKDNTDQKVIDLRKTYAFA